MHTRRFYGTEAREYIQPARKYKLTGGNSLRNPAIILVVLFQSRGLNVFHIIASVY